MKIRFADHITASHREGIIAEIAEVATAERVDEDSYTITVIKQRWYPSVLMFLQGEQIVGTLELDETSNS